jgi:hypothetical protein
MAGALAPRPCLCQKKIENAPAQIRRGQSAKGFLEMTAGSPPKRVRVKASDQKKQVRTSMYWDDDRHEGLAVLTESMCQIHDAAKVCEGEGKGRIAEIATILGKNVRSIQAAISYARSSYDGSLDSFLFGGTPPRGITVPTAKVVAACRAAWDFRGHCRKAGLKSEAYYDWLRRGYLPTFDLLLWLFGWNQPKNLFVVGPKLQQARQEKTQDRICRAARIHWTTPHHWQRNPRWREALGEAMRVAEMTGRYETLANRYEPWKLLDPRTRRFIWSYAVHATLRACAERAGIDRGHFENLMNDAKRKRCKEIVERYLKGEEWRSNGEPFRRGHRPFGLIAPNVYVPTPGMARKCLGGKGYGFRDIAKRAMTEHGVSRLRALPAFLQWFADWVMPWKNRGQRIVYVDGAPKLRKVKGPPSVDPSARPGEVKGQTENRVSLDHQTGLTDTSSGNEPATTPPQRQVKDRTKETFVPSRFEERILEALEGNALTASKLQDALITDRKRLYRDGLNELKAEGLVRKWRGGRGYYRPDAPPPGLSQWLEKKRTLLIPKI